MEKWSNKKAKSIGSCSLFNSTCWLLRISKAKSKTFPDVLMLGVESNQQKTWRSKQWWGGSRSLKYVICSVVIHTLYTGSWYSKFCVQLFPKQLDASTKSWYHRLLPPQQSRKHTWKDSLLWQAIFCLWRYFWAFPTSILWVFLPISAKPEPFATS